MKEVSSIPSSPAPRLIFSSKGSAYTLVELLIVLAMLGLLLSVSANAYEQYATRGYRTNAQTTLHRLAVLLNTYKLRRVGQGYLGADEAPEVVELLEQLKSNSHYRFSLGVAKAGDAFLVRATPKNETLQAGDGMLTLNQLGVGCWYEGLDEVEELETCVNGSYW